MALSVEDIHKAVDLLQETDLLLMQLESPVEVVSAAVELAHAHQVPVVLNPAPAQPLSKPLLANVNVLTPNENELALLTGQDDLENGIQTLREWGVKTVVVTLGAKGARVVSDSVDQFLPAYQVTAVDTTAAGDAFNGALAVALAEGKPLLEAVHYGMAAGALAATKMGAQPSLPTRAAVEEFLSRESAAVD